MENIGMIIENMEITRMKNLRFVKYFYAKPGRKKIKCEAEKSC